MLFYITLILVGTMKTIFLSSAIKRTVILLYRQCQVMLQYIHIDVSNFLGDHPPFLCYIIVSVFFPIIVLPLYLVTVQLGVVLTTHQNIHVFAYVLHELVLNV